MKVSINKTNRNSKINLISKTYRQMIVKTSMRMMILVAGAVLVFGCGEDEQEYICKMGELQACPCIGGDQSVQECAEDRQGWDQCQCVSGEGQGEDSGGADSGGEDSGGEVSGG